MVNFIHLRIHHTSRIPYLFHSFLDFVIYEVTALIFPKNQRQCASFSINVAILFLSFKRAIIVPNKLIDSQHHKQLRRKNLIAFHSLSHFTLTTTQLNLLFFKTLNFLRNDSETGTIFSQPPVISFKRDKNSGNFLARSSFQSNDHSGTFKCALSRCKTCPFIHNVEKMSEPKRSIKITGHFTCTSAIVIYCITCKYYKKLYIGETGWRLIDQFREHLRDLERNNKEASKPVAGHLNFSNHSKQHMAVCSLLLHLGSSESRKTQEQKFIFRIGTLNPQGINKRFLFN